MLQMSINLFLELRKIHRELNVAHHDLLAKNVLFSPNETNPEKSKFTIIDFGGASYTFWLDDWYWKTVDIANIWNILYAFFEQHINENEKTNNIYFDFMSNIYLINFCNSPVAHKISLFAIGALAQDDYFLILF